MSISITVCSGKGGTGKSTIVANLGAALARLGKDVVILDADINMGSLELILGMEGMEVTLRDVLAGEAEVYEAIYTGPSGLRVIPAGVSLANLQGLARENLGEVVNALKRVDFLLIDSPPGLGRGVISAISASREVLLVVVPEISSLSDALKAKIVANKLGAHVVGAVLNRTTFQAGDLSAKEVGSILEVPILAVVPEDVEVRRSSAFAQPFVLRAPDSPAAQAVMELASKIAGEVYMPPGRGETFIERLLQVIDE